jgi:hypothetical protein
MKYSMIVFLFTFLAVVSTYAHTGETRTLQWDGSARSESLRLHGTLTHTEYRVETVARTCYRDEYAGQSCGYVPDTYCGYTRQVCHGEVERCDGHAGGGRRRPGSGGGTAVPRQCRMVPDCRTESYCDTRMDYRCRDLYRTVAYTCYRDERIPYEVKDADTVADVEVLFPSFNKRTVSAPERITVKLHGQELSVSGSSPAKETLLIGRVEQQKIASHGDLVQIAGRLQVRAVPFELIDQALMIQDLAVDSGDVLTFTTGDVQNQIPVAMHLKISKNRTLAPDKKLIERDLNPSEVQITPMGNGRATVTVNLNALGMEEALKKGDYKIKLTSRIMKNAMALINAGDLPSDPDREREIKIKR